MSNANLQNTNGTNKLPEGFVYVDEVNPNIKVNLGYYEADNFLGKPVAGYLQPYRAILTKQAAQALDMVQKELEPFGLGLKIRDAYRPQKAVDAFVTWTKDTQDTKTKERYYPTVAKENLISGHYIADKSGHTRGSTVDLTIISLKPGSFGQELDMGTHWDFLGEDSAPDAPKIGMSSRAHRLLLRHLMLKAGFEPLHTEWWHFRLKNEPFPNTYFDFDMQ